MLNDAKEVIKGLSDSQRPIYRAHIALGTPAPDVLEPITRVNSPENQIDFVPSDLGLEIGPIIAGNLASEVPVQVGWISLSIGGCGYLYPWSLAETMQRASSSESIKTLTDIVRATWPVPSTAPDHEIVEIRRQLPDVWPYEVDRHWDWYWGAHETG